MMSDYLNMGQMDAAPRLNGAAPRAKFADVVLPTFPQRAETTRRKTKKRAIAYFTANDA